MVAWSCARTEFCCPATVGGATVVGSRAERAASAQVGRIPQVPHAFLVVLTVEHPLHVHVLGLAAAARPAKEGWPTQCQPPDGSRRHSEVEGDCAGE